MKKYLTPSIEEWKLTSADVISISSNEGSGDGDGVGFGEIFPNFGK